MKIKILSFATIVLLLISCQGQISKSFETIDSDAFANKLKTTENPQLIDVRTPEEYNGGHINNSTNINWNSNDFISNVEKLDKSKPVFVYCKSGGRSASASSKLAELGFKEIYNLNGGFMKWEASGKSAPSDEAIGMSGQDYTTLINSQDRVLIDFNAKWCAPCKLMKPYLTRLEEEMKEQVKIVSIDVDENKTISNQLKIDALPTIIIYEKGKEVWRNIGYISEEDLKKHL